jgi:hypothetical protein
MEVTVVMLDHLNGAIHRNPVGMHIEQAHKDTYHYTFVVEVFCLLDFLHYYHFTISRSNDDTFGIALETADGTLEKVYQYEIYTNAYPRKQVEGSLIGEKIV